MRTTVGACGAALLLVTGLAAPAWAAPGSAAAPAAAQGCTNKGTVPKHARTVDIGDVDHDGKDDTAFYAAIPGTSDADGHYDYGIHTAAGGVIKVRDRMTGMNVHGGWFSGTDGMGFVAVIDDTETATLYAFRGCRLIQPQHVGGGAYVMKIGARAKGATGVACNDQNGGVLLERATARKRSNGNYDIVRTVIDVSADGRTAKRQGGKGSTEVRWSNLKPSDPRVQQARGSHCNDVPKVDARLD
ncbi:hypothetical protein [Amnibacterium endophyticum]|uniref:Uncharacterized protein n=1 Tax=Amnibacterium endophyticum TaxID=2109337 RepID=A0ABW4LHC1_9MICO